MTFTKEFMGFRRTNESSGLGDLKQQRIGAAGEKCVLHSLRLRGFVKLEHNTKGTGATDIHGIKNGRNYYFQVKSTIQSTEPKMTEDEKERILERADANSGVAVMAIVYLKETVRGEYELRKSIEYLSVKTGKTILNLS